MAVSFTNLDANSTTTDGVGPWTTGSITPTADQPVLLVVSVSVTTQPTPTITVSGCNLTWSTVTNTAVSTTRSTWIFLGIGASPTTGALTITGDGTTTITSVIWSANQTAGVDTTTASGVVQSKQGAPAAATSCSVAFTGTVISSNGTFAGVVIQAGDATLAPGSGWTQASQQQVLTPVSTLLVEYAGSAQQNITATWTTSSGQKVVGCELAATLVPTAPTGLTANAVSSTEIDLSWTAPTGPSPVGYDVERDGNIIATGVAGTSYADTGLTASTSYTYNVRSDY